MYSDILSTFEADIVRVFHGNVGVSLLHIDSGFKCRVTNSSLIVEPIESNDDRWWKILNDDLLIFLKL